MVSMFLHNFSTTAVLLTNLICKSVKNPITWTEECEAAFNALKEQTYLGPVLKSPVFNKEFIVHVDASALWIAADMGQGDPGEERPIAYLSRPRETLYSTVEKEGLVIKWALGSLMYYLLGIGFILERDH